MNTLKEIQGRYYQEAEVVMLATEKESRLHLESPHLKSIKLVLYKESLIQGKSYLNQHLYILSDEEIKEGDWVLQTHYGVNSITICDGQNKSVINNKTENLFAKKIIATTDESLHIPFVTPGNEELEVYEYNILPQPSDSFIRKYIEEYNKGSVITKILVEYVGYYGTEMVSYDMFPKTLYRIKVDSNNAITIKKVEPELYTIEQIFSVLDKGIEEFKIRADFRGEWHPSYDIKYNKDWIKNNL